MTPEQFEKFAARVEAEAWPCKYGHINCSDRRGGPCFDEEEINTFGNHEEESEGDDE